MNQTVRTRFAPSPTGYLHVGGLRTALYNYLFAKNNNGKMILRIEDTDRNRLVEGAVENLISTLKLMGIEYDEGPDIGGEFGPYTQSERQDIYHEKVKELLDNGDAYHCFCTAEELDAMRQKQEANKEQPKYDGTCRSLSKAEIEQRLNDKTPHVIRLKMPQSGETRFKDIVRGEVVVQNELVDDQILIKSDGYPTYHLANVVDDHSMGITHVIRGEEWLLSVPKHIRLYEAFGWEVPKMAHVPLLLNPDRSKLSKRQGDVAVEDFLAKGYLPEAMNNFVALLGWNPGNDEEIFDLAYLIENFSLERVNKSGAVFDVQKLDWMNGHYLRELSPENRNRFLTPFLNAAGYDTSDTQKTAKIIEAVYKNISRGSEIAQQAAIFYNTAIEITEPDAREIIAADSAKIVLQNFLNRIKDMEKLDLDIFMATMKTVQKETGIKKKELWMPIRVALTGVAHGPDLPLVIEILGKDKIQSYIEQILAN